MDVCQTSILAFLTGKNKEKLIMSEKSAVLQKYYKNIKNILQCDINVYKREILLYKCSKQILGGNYDNI